MSNTKKDSNKFVFFIPGLFCTQLKNGEDVIWPCNNTEFFINYQVEKKLKPFLGKMLGKKTNSKNISTVVEEATEQISDPNLIIGGVTDNYANIIGFLKKEVKNYFIFKYDWRKSFETIVAEFAKTVESFNLEGKDIHIWGHSAGGVIATYYLNGFYNRAEEYPKNFKRIKHCVCIGSPIKGSIKALNAILGFEKQSVITRHEIKNAIDKGSIQTLYELIPSNLLNLFSYSDGDHEILPKEKIIGLLIKKGFNEDNLLTALKFRKKMDLLQYRSDDNVNFLFIIGSYISHVCHRYLVDRNTNEITCVYNELASDGSVLFNEAIPVDNNSFRTHYVSGKHAYLTEGDEVLELLREEFNSSNDAKIVVKGAIINTPSKKNGNRLEFSLSLVMNNKHYPITDVNAGHINFSNKTISSDITDQLKNKKGVFSFQTLNNYGHLKMRNATFAYKKEEDVQIINVANNEEDGLIDESEENDISTSSNNEKKNIIKHKEVYIDLENPNLNFSI